MLHIRVGVIYDTKKTLLCSKLSSFYSAMLPDIPPVKKIPPYQKKIFVFQNFLHSVPILISSLSAELWNCSGHAIVSLHHFPFWPRLLIGPILSFQGHLPQFSSSCDPSSSVTCIAQCSRTVPFFLSVRIGWLDSANPTLQSR